MGYPCLLSGEDLLSSFGILARSRDLFYDCKHSNELF